MTLRGGLAHRDSIGVAQRYADGAVQWLTAARGMLHEEMWAPAERTHDAELYQLWLNLPARSKMNPPRVRVLEPANAATRSTVPASELKVRAAARRAADPAGDKTRLRKKFIEKLKTYVGVPYAERYHKPGDALHGRPLYLDCCALIRRAAQEMRADFGFDLGHWNQAYQFATCPTAREFPATVEPGDLLFVKGTFVVAPDVAALRSAGSFSNSSPKSSSSSASVKCRS